MANIVFEDALKLFLTAPHIVSCRMETLKKPTTCSLRVLRAGGEVKNLEEEEGEELEEDEGEEEWEEEEW